LVMPSWERNLPQVIDVNLPDKLIPLFSQPARFRGAYGGRGGAKTIAFANMAIIEIMKKMHKPWRFLCGRELQKSLKDSVFSVIAAQITELGVQDRFDVGKEFIRHKDSGNEFLFYGLRSNIAEVKGLHGVRRTWLEEAQKVSQGSLTYMLPTVMRDFDDCELWASWNPDDEDDPIHDMFVTNPAPDTLAVKINWSDNPWFPAGLDKLRLEDKRKRPEAYDWIWEGNFNINMEGAVYAKWVNAREDAGAFKNDLFDPALPVHTAWDIGYSDYTTIWWYQVIGGEIRIIDYYEHNREGIQHYVSQLFGIEIDIEGATIDGKLLYKRGAEIPEIVHRKQYKYGKHWVPHDAAHKLFAANGRSVVEQANDLGVRMYVMPALPQQKQIDLARATLPQCWFDPVRCADGIRALRKYHFDYDEDKQRYKDTPEHDWSSHGVDAFEVLAQVQKQPIMEQAKPEPKFWHDVASKDIFFPSQETKRERI
jgi:phage terminase large subunit